MPEISRFLGIVVGMYHSDHGPPHFHAKYGSYEVAVRIESGATVGRFPPRALRLVREWTRLRRTELFEDWKLAQARKPLKRIAPLE